MKKYKKCKVIIDDEFNSTIDVRAIQLVVNHKGQIYNRAKIRELERKISQNEEEMSI